MDPGDELFPAARLTPSVRLRRRLGGGAMGSVWLAHDAERGEDVVVKVMARELASDPLFLGRFREEVATASLIDHPNVVRVLGASVSTRGTPFLVMEHLEGRDVQATLVEDGALAPSLVRSIVRQLCGALAEVHARGIVHRDVKAANVFLCGDPAAPRVKLLDFGVAKRAHVTNLTRTGDAVGTLYTMSPEQVLDSKSIDHRSDLWSVGVLAFQMLTGRSPFARGTVASVSIAILRGPLPMPSRVNPSLAPAVDAWFSSACERDRDRRFQNARALATALEDALADAPDTTRAP